MLYETDRHEDYDTGSRVVVLAVRVHQAHRVHHGREEGTDIRKIS